MKIKLLLLFVFGLCPLAALAQSLSPTNAPGSVSLVWTNGPGTNVINHDNVYYGIASGIYTNKLSTGASQSTTVSNLVRGTTYYFAVTSTDTNNLESVFSNEVKASIPVPPSAPTALTITSGN
jgi:hypothetical protein